MSTPRRPLRRRSGLLALSALVACAALSACDDGPSTGDDDTSGSSAVGGDCPTDLHQVVSDYTYTGTQQEMDFYQFGDVVYFYGAADGEFAGWRVVDGNATKLPDGWQPAGVTDSGVVLVSSGTDPAVQVVDADGGTVWQNAYPGEQIERDSILAGRTEILIHDKHTDSTFVAVDAATGKQNGDDFDIPDAYNPASPASPSDEATTGDYWLDIPTRKPITDIDNGNQGAVPGPDSWLELVYDEDAEQYDATLHAGDDERPATLKPENGFPIDLCSGHMVVISELGAVKVVDLEGNGDTIGSVETSTDDIEASVDGPYLAVMTETYGSDSESTDYAYHLTVYGPQ